MLREPSVDSPPSAEGLARRGICATGCCPIALGHNNGLLDALKSPAERESYARHAIHNGSESPSVSAARRLRSVG